MEPKLEYLGESLEFWLASLAAIDPRDPQDRSWAVRAIVCIGPEARDAVPALRRLLSTAITLRIRVNSLKALQSLAYDDDDALSAVLDQVALHSDTQHRDAGAHLARASLSGICRGGRWARISLPNRVVAGKRLLEFLTNEEQDNECRWRAAMATGKLGISDFHIVNNLLSCLSENRKRATSPYDIAEASLYALGCVARGYPEAEARIRSLVVDTQLGPSAAGALWALDPVNNFATVDQLCYSGLTSREAGRHEAWAAVLTESYSSLGLELCAAWRNRNHNPLARRWYDMYCHPRMALQRSDAAILLGKSGLYFDEIFPCLSEMLADRYMPNRHEVMEILGSFGRRATGTLPTLQLLANAKDAPFKDRRAALAAIEAILAAEGVDRK